MRRYEGATVLVTGAARGFGRLAAERFAAEGARLVLNDIAAEAVDEVVRMLRERGAEAVARAGDVSQEETAQALVEQSLAAYGRLDVAINNAGIGQPYCKLPEIEAEIAARVISVDLMGVFLALKHQLPVMERQGSGAILNVASAAGVIGAPLLAAYAAAKHGVIGLTRTAAAEYARKGVRVNAVCPAFAATDMVLGELAHMRGTPEEALGRIVAAVPMRRLAKPEEIVQAMLWICSPENGFMTGHALILDGGLTAL